MKPLVRWFLFITVGLPAQMLVYLVYPFVYLYWKIFIYKKADRQLFPPHERVYLDPRFMKTRANGLLLDNPDDHGAFTMYGAIEALGLSLLLHEGNFLRRYEEGKPHNMDKVSGDVVVAWCFAATHEGVNLEALEWDIRGAARNYLKYLGTRSFDNVSKGWVSNRSNNFGVNYCPDSALLSVGQPCAGPQFYTNSSLFALASLFSIRWKLVFWLHWLVLGGWYWAFWPMIYTNKKPLHYVKDITMKALWVHKFVFGKQFWIVKPMKVIQKLCTVRNDLFDAMLGDLSNKESLPMVMNAFFSQKADATSRLKDGEMNPFLSAAIVQLYNQSRGLK